MNLYDAIRSLAGEAGISLIPVPSLAERIVRAAGKVSLSERAVEYGRTRYMTVSAAEVRMATSRALAAEGVYTYVLPTIIEADDQASEVVGLVVFVETETGDAFGVPFRASAGGLGGAKNTAAAIAYGAKYALLWAMGLGAADEADEAVEEARAEPKRPAADRLTLRDRLAQVWAEAEDAGVNVTAVLAEHGIEAASPAQVPPGDIVRAGRALRAAIAEAQEEQEYTAAEQAAKEAEDV